MKVLENLNAKKLDRKKFLFATGLVALGGFLLAKFPFKFISNRAENIISNNKIQVRENPASIKRINA